MESPDLETIKKHVKELRQYVIKGGLVEAVVNDMDAMIAYIEEMEEDTERAYNDGLERGEQQDLAD